MPPSSFCSSVPLAAALGSGGSLSPLLRRHSLFASYVEWPFIHGTPRRVSRTPPLCVLKAEEMQEVFSCIHIRQLRLAGKRYLSVLAGVLVQGGEVGLKQILPITIGQALKNLVKHAHKTQRKHLQD